MSTNEVEKTKTVTLNVNGAWQATSVVTGKTAEFYAFSSRYVVDSHIVVAEGDHRVTTFHGRWHNIEGARRFAASCGGRDNPDTLQVGQTAVVVREVPEYWYAPAFGRVPS